MLADVYCIGAQPLPKLVLGCTCLLNKSFENTVGKGETAHYEQCLLPCRRTFCQFCEIKKLSAASSFNLEESRICRLGGKVKDYTTCNSSRITNRQVCANYKSVMLKGFLHGMFVFHQFLFMKQTYPVSILGRAIAIFTHFFFRQMRDIPALKLNDVHLLFEGKRYLLYNPTKVYSRNSASFQIAYMYIVVNSSQLTV